MIPAERRRYILAAARKNGVVSIRELVDALGASEPTVRRDIRDLATEGLLERTRGGGVLPDALASEASYLEKAGEALVEKERIAAEAVQLVEPGDSVLLGPGTTTLALAERISAIPDVAVVTNSLLVVQALGTAPDVEVVMTGGSLRRPIFALVGPEVERSLHSLRVSKVFISGNGVTAERGLTTPSLVVAAADRALVASAAQVIVLADYTKIGDETLCQTVPASDIDVLVTDSRAKPEELQRLAELGVQVRVAGNGGPATEGFASS